MSEGLTFERYCEALGIKIRPLTDEERAIVYRNHDELVRLAELGVTENDWKEYEEHQILRDKERTSEENERYAYLHQKLLRDGLFSPEFL